jgi:hypothetical protein
MTEEQYGPGEIFRSKFAMFAWVEVVMAEAPLTICWDPVNHDSSPCTEATLVIAGVTW